ncbi:MAG TPA: Tim44 domain-containing protein [Methylomirabilota bacterium]|jgi:predicted lipid-binding transport protein (Tim44 family)|nr:Tim44 domain-containing protein [Methylomirabilota bacterium]
MTRRRFVPLLGLVLMGLLFVTTTEAWARATGGGSRGSRTYSAPSRPSPTSPATPSRPTTSTSPAAPQRPGIFGGFGGVLGGLLIGGLLGGLLFGHPGFGVGLLDVLLIGGGLMLLIAFLRRRQTAGEPAYAMAGARGAAEGAPWGSSGGATMEAPAAPDDLERGLAHIRTMDPGFEPAAFATIARSAFLDLQRAVAARDVAPLRDRLTSEMSAMLQSQCDRLRSSRQTNRIEKIEIRRIDVTEAWQESGRDYVTVYLAASLLDYVVDDGTGAVIDGSPTQRQEIEEYWTFTRPVGTGAWKLSAIQTG